MKMKTRELEKLLKALANRRRLAIIRLLKNTSRLSVTDIARNIRLSVKATSKHLTILKAANLVEFQQTKLQVYYSLARGLSRPARGVISLI